MKRRTFVSFSILSGAAFTLLPLNYLSARTSKYETLKIHTADPHIRHGHLYADERLFNCSCPWIKNIRRDIFLRSEYSSDQGDLKHFTIETDDEMIGLGLENDHALLNINGNSISELENEITLKSGRKLKYINAGEDGSIMVHSSSLVLPIDGSLNLDNCKLSNNKAAYVLNRSLSLEYNRNSQFLIINS